MYSFGKTSKSRLATCDSRLQRLFNEVIKEVDCTIICGHRTRAEQDAAVKAKVSKTPWPKSKHNFYPSKAVDVAPYPIDWKDIKRFEAFAAVVLKKASELKIPIRWGGDWDRDGDRTDQTFHDLPHWELID